MMRYVLSGYGMSREQPARRFVRQSTTPRAGRGSIPYEMRALDVKFLRWDNSFLHLIDLEIQEMIAEYLRRKEDAVFD